MTYLPIAPILVRSKYYPLCSTSSQRKITFKDRAAGVGGCSLDLDKLNRYARKVAAGGVMIACHE